ncbi:MAG: pyridoxamine 5'-phosphate oxidase family protein [Anaerolineae bacterium]|nr:MAG: pyridoxamine 5'-phosphate oxidase family protein [Anaerolineae bacterium]
MYFQDCIQFATENPVCYMATIDGRQPRVRGLLMWFADENGFYFATFSPKAFTKQLKKNSRVEVCFYNNPAELSGARQMRVTGKVEFLDDKELLAKINTERGFLEQLAGQPLEHLWVVFRIHTGEAHFWTLQDVLKEPELERIKF